MIVPFDFATHFPAVLPELLLTALAVVVLALDLYWPRSRSRYIAYVAGFGLLATAVAPLAFLLGGGFEADQALIWGGMIRHDALAQIFKIMVMVGGAITCFIAVNSRDVGHKGEFYLIVIVATLGASLLSAAADLIMVFVAVETLSIPLYILAAFNRESDRSMESGMKYFLFGSFASAIMLFGFSLLYGLTGQTNLYLIGDTLSANPAILGENLIPLMGTLVLIIVGFAFKISAVPFHFWTPDVYEGSPTPVTAFVSTASKAASFAVLMRFLIAAFPASVVVDGQSIKDFWVALIIVLSIVTMTLGNVLALAQRNIKRLLAYSSIAQAGYALIGVAAIQAAGPDTVVAGQSVASVTFYLFMYTFTNLLAFGVIVLFSETTGSEEIADFAGLNRRKPMVALAMTIALLSLGGVPPAAGFFGKFFLFNAAVDADLAWLAMVGVINAIVSLYYYLIVIKVMYVDHSADENEPMPVNATHSWVLATTAIVVIILGSVGVQFVFDRALEAGNQLLAIAPMLTSMLP